MEVKITQCTVGQFNLLSNERTLSFSMSLFHEGERIKEGPLYARISYEGHPNERDDFERAFEHLDQTLDMCMDYAMRIISSHDYKGEARLFVRLFEEHRTEIEANFNQAVKKIREDKIAKLRKEIEEIEQTMNGEPHTFPMLAPIHNRPIINKMNLYELWINQSNEKLQDLKEGTPSYNSEMEKMKKHQEMLESFRQKLLPEPAEA